MDVEDEFLFSDAGSIIKRPHTAFAFPHAELIGIGNVREADAVGEEQIRERDHRRPVAGNAGRDFGHDAIEKRADGGTIGETEVFLAGNGKIYFGAGVKDKSAEQSEN